MFIKHLAKFAALAMAVSLWSCSDDLPENGSNVEEEQVGDFYATVTLDFPTAPGSRSETVPPEDYPAQSENGFELGKTNENTVSSVLVILAYKDGNNYKWIDKATTIPENVTGSQNNNQYLLRFRSNELVNAIDKGYVTGSTGEGTGGSPLYIFVYCNVSEEFSRAINSTAFSPLEATNDRELETDNNTPSGITANSLKIPVDKVDVVEGEVAPIRNSISQRNLFLMSNATIKTYPFSGTKTQILDNLKTYNKPANPLDIGTVKVERAACRIDYKAPNYGEGNEGFPVNYLNTTYGYIALEGMALFNEAKYFYMFPRVSSEAPATSTSITLCGQETTSNWVVTPNWPTLQNYDGQYTSAISNLFNYPTATREKTGNANNGPNVGTFPRNFTYTWPSTSNDDNHTSSQQPTWPNNTDIDPEGYKIWRYTTENTIPGISAQQNGISTGIYFRASLQSMANPGDNSLAASIKTAMDNGEPIYAFSDNLNEAQNNTADVHTLIGSAQDVWNMAYGAQSGVIAQGFLQGFKYGLFIIKTTDPETNAKSTLDPTKLDITNADDLKLIFTEGNEATTAEKFQTLTNSQVLTTVSSVDEDGHTVQTNIYLKDLGFYGYYATPKEGSYKYYVYYPYYIRHDDNYNNGEMSQMEFATVRNNVYKLQVTNITRIGLPGDVPPDPGTPDESEDIYLQVKVQVLDWVVRMNNNIVF